MDSNVDSEHGPLRVLFVRPYHSRVLRRDLASQTAGRVAVEDAQAVAQTVPSLAGAKILRMAARTNSFFHGATTGPRLPRESDLAWFEK